MRNGVLASRKGAPLVVDDDPTGTQTVHSVPVLADWSVEALEAALGEDHPCFYLLANTRALPPAEAVARAEEIGTNLRVAAASRPRPAHPRRGLARRLDLTWPLSGRDGRPGAWPGWPSPAVLLAPLFLEGGRFTAYDTHYVAAADGSGALTPAGDTEFARDRAFGYKASHLPSWVEEKTEGAVRAADVCSLSLEMIRSGGPDAVQAALAALLRRRKCRCRRKRAHAIGHGGGLSRLHAGREGGRASHGLLYRSAGALVAARAAIPPRLCSPPPRCSGWRRLRARRMTAWRGRRRRAGRRRLICG